MSAQPGENALADSDEVALLRRRARRRLIGAIALVVFAVIVLPIVLDEEPKPIGQDIVIQIPNQNASKFNPKIPVPPPPEVATPAAPKPAATSSNETKPPAESTATKSEPAAPTKSAAASAADAKLLANAKDPVTGKSAAKANPAPEAESARAQAVLEGDAYVVPLGAFLNQANVKSLQSKVAAAGIKSYSEVQTTAKGDQIRVRAGPFASRDAAELARVQLQAAGLTVGSVTKQ